MSAQEKNEFKIDVTLIDWEKSQKSQIFGLRRFYVMEDALSPATHQ